MNENAKVEQGGGQERKWCHGKRRPHGFIGGLILGGLLVGGLAWAGAHVLASGGGPFGGGFGGGCHGPRGAMSQQNCQEHAQFAAEWALRKVDATEEQQAKVKQIVGDAVRDLSALAERHHSNREAVAGELSKAEVDRQAIERIRKAEMELADQASSRVMTAVADAAETLTVEQRKELIAFIHEMHK